MTAGVTNVGLKFLSYAFATFNRRERNTFNPYCLLTSLLVSSQVTPVTGTRMMNFSYTQNLFGLELKVRGLGFGTRGLGLDSNLMDSTTSLLKSPHTFSR